MLLHSSKCRDSYAAVRYWTGSSIAEVCCPTPSLCFSFFTTVLLMAGTLLVMLTTLQYCCRCTAHHAIVLTASMPLVGRNYLPPSTLSSFLCTVLKFFNQFELKASFRGTFWLHTLYDYLQAENVKCAECCLGVWTVFEEARIFILWFTLRFCDIWC